MSRNFRQSPFFAAALCAASLAFAQTASAAVVLTLTTTNDYILTRPVSTNLLGLGMGPTNSYAIPRAEDLSFLREAFTERTYAIHGENFAPIMNDLPEASHILCSGIFDDEVNNLLYFPLSYGFWPPYTRYVAGGYVADTFSLDDTLAYFGFNESLPSDFSVDGISTDTTNGLAFVTQTTFEDCFIPTSSIPTNVSFRGTVDMHNVTNAYHVLGLSHTILGEPVYSLQSSTSDDGVSAIQSWTIEIPSQNRSVASYSYSPYSWTDSEGVSHSGRYASGYTLTDWTNDTSVVTGTTAYASGYTVYGQASERKEAPVGWKRTGQSGDNYYESVPLGVFASSRSVGALARWPLEAYIELRHLCLTTNSVVSPDPTDLQAIQNDYLDWVELACVSRFRCDMLESVAGDTSQAYSTNYVERYAVVYHTEEADIVALTNGFYVCRATESYKDIVSLAYSLCGGSPAMPTAPDPEVPANSEYAQTTFTTTATRRRTLTLVDFFCYPIISRRRFHADFTLP